MKFNMLNEDISYDEIKSQPYFNQFKNLRLYHGSRNKVNYPTLIPYRFREKPVDTPTELHNIINSISEEKLGIPVRNLKFVYNRAMQTLPYGDPHIIVPKGDFTLYAVKGLYDLTTEYDLDSFDGIFYNNIFLGIIETLKKKLQDFSDDIDISTSNIILDGVYKKYSQNIHAFSDPDIKNIYHEYIMFYLKGAVKKSIIDSIEKSVFDVIHQTVSDEYKEFAMDYIASIEKIGSDSELIGENTELMLYAPNGMYVIPERTKLYNILQ